MGLLVVRRRRKYAPELNAYFITNPGSCGTGVYYFQLPAPCFLDGRILSLNLEYLWLLTQAPQVILLALPMEMPWSLHGFAGFPLIDTAEIDGSVENVNSPGTYPSET